MNVKKSVPSITEKEVEPKLEWGASVEDHIAVSQKEGASLGNVTNIYINLKNKKISALELKKSLWGDKFFVLVNDITFIGEDIVFVNEKNSAKAFDKFDQSKHRDLNKLKGTRITTLNGKHLGELDDIDISTTTFEISEFSLKSGQRMPVKTSEITIGEDEILVPAEYESKITKIKKAITTSYGKEFITNLSRTFHLNKDQQPNSKHKPRI